MTDNSAVAATFSDVRIVKGRGVLQLVMEIPLEAADAALRALGGIPTPASERWVGLALLERGAVEGRRDVRSVKPDRKAVARRAYAEKEAPERAVARAGMLAGDEEFHRWLAATGRCMVLWEGDAEESIRRECGVESRAELATNDEARARFDRMVAAFEDWKAGYGEVL
jgi:hypothetical protein